MDSTESDALTRILTPTLPKPDWEHWRHQTTATLWEAAALVCDIDPRGLAVNFLVPIPPAYEDLKRMAISSRPTNGLIPRDRFDSDCPDNSPVDLAQFGAWAGEIGYRLPANFPREVSTKTIEAYGWPWGSHTTSLLEKMAQAASRFWSRYDPEDPTTAPTNEQVSIWLMENGVPKRTAEVMATILRADGLTTGPRKSR